MDHTNNLFQQAQKYIPGGVNSPVRAFKGVGGDPIFFSHGKGPYLYDVNDRPYIDYVCSWGPLIVGHAHPEVIGAVQRAAEQGLGFGAPTPVEVEMAETLCRLVPSMDLVRMVSSGTEATMSAIRLARGFTKRDKILKFEGCYHGHGDSLLVKAGSGALTLGVPTSGGIPAIVAEQTIVLPYNDLETVQKAFRQFGNDIAAVIVEPVAGNMNCILPSLGFLAGLRKICNDYDTVLVFDEVMTGFRVALGGAQSLYNITPDLTTLGKVVGGGLPVAAFGGKKEIMEMIAPLGPVYQAGTLSGNPVAMAAGLATLKLIQVPDFYKNLTNQTQKLIQGLLARAEAAGIHMTANQVGGMFGLFFTEKKEVTDYHQATHCNSERFKFFFHEMLKEGIYFAPSAFEAGFVSSTHGDKEIEATHLAAEKVFSRI
ncbi:glutamate-1-semialdehyde 2,1-aminomutase [Candidatus Nitrosacidococcus sp. I8]|uniref:glutamate-1-semialdehyde 2,1-aminomutase n=1 Tax=Candidatus Nitrosacidococcus sp. I8 TaxID=2942908 RepID=UPI002227C7EE|nr:glutamate-1-semialdehyde 2,1-aminomutase [Candidatus Nitrosacidococcus sp. I8]CAH9019734.1 Glutamate-1-semialdehyde 2,1-aminomutase [Candidatus Nitrosacidococcus sp. I8]